MRPPAHIIALASALALLAGAARGLTQAPASAYVTVDSLLDLGGRAAGLTSLRQVRRRLRLDSAALVYLRAEGQRRGDCRAEGFAWAQLGRRERNAARYDAALARYDSAIAVGLRCGDSLLVAAGYNGRGVVYRRRDRIAEAVEAHEAARAVAVAMRPVTEAVAFERGVAVNSLGNVYLSTEEWAAAEAAFRESMRLQEPLGNDLGMAINYHNLGFALERQGALDTAMAYYRRSLAYNERIGSDVGRALCHTSMADLQLLRGRDGDALRLAREAVAYARRSGDAFYVASAQVVFGKALTRVGRPAEARAALAEGLAVAEDKGYAYEGGRAHAALAELDSLRGDYLAALRHRNAAAAAQRALVNEVNQRIVGSLSARLQTERQAAEIQALARENERVRERAHRTRLTLAGVLAAVGLLAAIAYVVYRQRELTAARARDRLERRRLASQMNPHFLFNALNSVKAFLIRNDREAAIRYLGAFAKLVRRILNSSINETVSLSEELENSRLYVEIENARLDDGIAFELSVAPGVDPEFARLPPLTLQPFLENAIWHGLQPSPRPRRLLLAVEEGVGGGVRIRVADNGIGRAAAAEARARRPPRDSVGLEVTRQRLAHYARVSGERATFRTVDLYDAGGEPAGTEVVLELGG